MMCSTSGGRARAGSWSWPPNKRLEAGGARRLRNEFFFSAPQLKRGPLGSHETMRALVVIGAFTVLASLSSVRPAPTQQTADTNRARQEIERMESERREALLHHDT